MRMPVELRDFMQSSSITKSVIKVFWRHLLRYKGGALLTFTSIIVVSILGVVTPWFYKLFFDTLVNSSILGVDKTAAGLVKIILILFAIKILSSALRRVRGFSSLGVQARVMRDLADTSFQYLIRHSYRFFTDSFSGSLTRKVNRLTRAFEDIMDQVEFSLLPLTITTIGILAVLFRRHFMLGLALFFGVLVFFALHFWVASWKQKYDFERAKKDSETTGVLADALSNSINIKLFSSYREEESLYRNVLEELRKLRSFTWSLNEWIDAAQGLIAVLIEVVMLYIAVLLWQRGHLTIGDFALIQVYLINLFERLWEFGRTLRRIYEGLSDAGEMVEILEAPHEVRDTPTAKPLAVEQGRIEFKSVGFSFHQTRSVLDRFNLAIYPGEKLALVGSSGAGKTVITKLLLRFYDIDAGEILIDGQNIAHATQDSLRGKIALVPQEPILFHRTLKENIRYGRPLASEDEVMDAAKRANCHEFISELPYGYDTYVGERGVKLSGGERQRVVIARAILKNAPILVLDEATSSLDSESEALIQRALVELMKGKTTIAIAHRLSTIMQMDRIVVIDKGKIIDEGTHGELLAKGGVYKKLWEIQAGGFMA